jgi:glycosyltransferase involved in cell wall biosynthesis
MVLRITFVLAGDNLSGGTRIIVQYASRLKARGHEVSVVARPRRRRSFLERLRGRLRDGAWPEHHKMKASYFDGSGVELKEIDGFRPVEAGDLPDADVVLGTFWTTAPWVHALPAEKGAKAQFIQGYEASEGEDTRELDASWRLPLRKIVISQWLKDLAETRFGDPGALVVPNGIDIAQFHADPRRKQAVPRVGLLYSSSPVKGVDISFAAVERARREIPELRLVSFGAEAPVSSLPLPRGTEFFQQPPQSRLKDIYASCDAWLFGSRREGFGLPILEAMACRTPVIGARTGAVPDLLKDGGGILVGSEDPEGMARAIVDVCRMPEDRWKALSDAAFARARRYTCDDAAALLEKALEAIVRAPASAAPNPSASSGGSRVP